MERKGLECSSSPVPACSSMAFSSCTHLHAAVFSLTEITWFIKNENGMCAGQQPTPSHGAAEWVLPTDISLSEEWLKTDL